MTERAWTTACPDWSERIVAGQSLVPCGALFPEEARQALDVFRSLKIVDAPGRPTFGEAGDQWVFDFVEAIFGAYDADSGVRLINEAFLCVAKKNGKSTIAAGIMLTALIRNWRGSNELIIVAPTIKAADNSFKPAADMVRADPQLNAASGGFLHIQDHLRAITHLRTRATLRILAADAGTVAGNKAAFVLVDELWEFGVRASADAMMREAAGGLVGRPEGFLICISTQSDRPPTGIWKDKLEYARKVRDGTVKDPKFLPVIYEFPGRMLKDGKHLLPENFYVTNPYLGRTAWGRNWISGELEKEQQKGPETRNVFLAKHLNVEISMSLRTDRWAGADYWEAAADETVTLETILDRCEVVVVGIDGGGLDDLFGLTVLGRQRAPVDGDADLYKRRWLSWSRAWCHRGVLERRKSEAPQLLDLQKVDELTIVDNLGVDIDEAVAIVKRIDDAGLLADKDAIGFDPVGVGMIVDAIVEAGIERNDETPRIIAVSQGYKLMGAIKTAERKLADGSMLHAKQPLMNWCVGNARTELRGNAVIVTKYASGVGKIDPLMALYNAVSLMSMNPEVPGSIYSAERGLRIW